MGEWRRSTKVYKSIPLEAILNFSRAKATCMFPFIHMNLFGENKDQKSNQPNKKISKKTFII